MFEPLAPLPHHLQPIWERYQSLKSNQSLPKALLLRGKLSEAVSLSHYIQNRLLCTSEKYRPCGECQSCRLMEAHPDLIMLSPLEGMEKVSVDVVRELKDTLFLSPQVSEKKLVFLGDLNSFNHQAWNALLKILEEPPDFVFFLAIASDIENILPTILSRFQQWLLPSDGLISGETEGFLALLSQKNELLQDLDTCIHGKCSVFVLAEKWSVHPLKDLLLVLYTLFSETIKLRCLHQPSQLQGLTNHQCFEALNQLTILMKQVRATASLNALLTIEIFLLNLNSQSRV